MKKFTLLFLTILILAAGIFATSQIWHKNPASTLDLHSVTTTTTTTEAPPEPAPIDRPAKAPIASSSTATNTPAPNATILVASTSYPVYISAGASVMDAMNTLASSHALIFAMHAESGLGAFIDSINGKENSNGYYWFLYINGKTSETGASQAYLHPGDVAQWRYEKSY